jgi:hypothetical protein
MQSLRVPVVKPQGVEEIYPYVLGESKVSALCREKYFIVLLPEFMWPKKSKSF